MYYARWLAGHHTITLKIDRPKLLLCVMSLRSVKLYLFSDGLSPLGSRAGNLAPLKHRFSCTNISSSGCTAAGVDSLLPGCVLFNRKLSVCNYLINCLVPRVTFNQIQHIGQFGYYVSADVQSVQAETVVICTSTKAHGV